MARWGCTGGEAVHGGVAREGSRGWTLRDPEAFSASSSVCQELGVRNLHIHKGPTIWPLDKDTFNIDDVDTAATMFPI